MAEKKKTNRSKEFLAEIGHKFTHEEMVRGAQAVNRAKAFKKSMREAGQILLWHDLNAVPEEAQVVDLLHQMGVEDPTGADAIMLAQYVKARRGDTDAARFIRDTVGEKPSGQITVSLADKPLDAIDFAALSDEELERLAAARNMTLIQGAVVEGEISEEEPAPVTNGPGYPWNYEERQE